MPYRVCEEIHFCYGHRLLGFDGPCRHPHGHNARVQVFLKGDRLDSQGMLYEFGHLKRLLKSWIDETLDHRMVLQREDPLVQALQGLGEPVCVVEGHPTAEFLAKMIFDFAVAQGLPVEEVRLGETETSWASYGKS